MNHPLVAQLQNLVAELSGKPPQELDPQLTFYELGLDSLFLTQLSRELGKALGVKVAFRQLAERWSSLEALARHLAERMPASKRSTDGVQFARQTALISVKSKRPIGRSTQQQERSAARTDATSVHQLFERQLALMKHQLEMLQAGVSAELEGSEPNRSRVAETSVRVVDPASLIDRREVPITRKLGTPDVVAEAQRVATDLPRRVHQVVDSGPAPGPSASSGQQPGRDDGTTWSCADGRPRCVGRWSDLAPAQQRHLRAFIERYRARTARSKAMAQAPHQSLVELRTRCGANPLWGELTYPLLSERASGSRVWDVDGNEYVDLVNGAGLDLLGHHHPVVVEALQRQLKHRAGIAPDSCLAAETAALLCELTGMERACFLGTPSEAVRAAIACARAHTGRDMIVVFGGDEPNSSEATLTARKSREDLPCSWPTALKLDRRAAPDVIELPFARAQSLQALRAVGERVAAVLIEPLPGGQAGLLPAEFVRALRSLTADLGALLVFDERASGFRCDPGGAQAYFEVRADLAVYGQNGGSCIPLGVVAGRSDLMNAMEREGIDLGHDAWPCGAGSSSPGVCHPLSLAACRAVLGHLKLAGPELQRTLVERTQQLAIRLNALFDNLQLPLEVIPVASVMHLRNKDESELGNLLWPHLLYQGVYLKPGFPGYLTVAHGERDLGCVVEAFRKSLETMVKGGFFPVAARRQSGVRPRRVAPDPPVIGARLGRNVEGRPAWFIAHPSLPNRYIQVS